MNHIFKGILHKIQTYCHERSIKCCLFWPLPFQPHLIQLSQMPHWGTLEQEPSFIQGNCLECSSSWLSTQLAHLQPLDLSPNVTYTRRHSPSILCIITSSLKLLLITRLYCLHNLVISKTTLFIHSFPVCLSNSNVSFLSFRYSTLTYQASVYSLIGTQ